MTESWFPPMSERSDSAAWQTNGARTMQDKIRDRLRVILGDS